jgi:hypothetical protein
MIAEKVLTSSARRAPGARIAVHPISAWNVTIVSGARNLASVPAASRAAINRTAIRRYAPNTSKGETGAAPRASESPTQIRRSPSLRN